VVGHVPAHLAGRSVALSTAMASFTVGLSGRTVVRREKERAGGLGLSCGGGERDSGREEEEMEAAADLTEEVSVLELMLE